MENRMLKTRNLRLARVKYYDTKHNGAELSQIDAYAFLEGVEGQFVNVFDPADGLAVLDRSLYSNTTKDGEDYGNRLIHVCGELIDGPCYVMDRIAVSKLMGVDVISTSQLRDYILKSSMFFVDRMSLIEQEKGIHKLAHIATYARDQKTMDAFKQYMASHEGGKQYVK